MAEGAKENWGSGEPYEQYVGRWSRNVAKDFLAWLGVAPRRVWGDVGCGTGASVGGILAECEPQRIVAIDRSEGFVAEAQRRTADARVCFDIGDATAIPWPNRSCDDLSDIAGKTGIPFKAE